MICNEFKGGIGTASRALKSEAGNYIVGVLVQCNFGRRPNLLIAGVPVGKEIPEQRAYEPEDGSIIIIVATDAPLLPQQLKRVAKRAGMGLARTGSFASNGSGDIFIAFSTANPEASTQEKVHTVQLLPNDALNPLFEATVQATEEAIVNAMVAAETMVGANDRRVIALPHERLVEVLRKYNRLAK